MNDEDVVGACQQFAKVVVGKRKMKEVMVFLRQCMVDEALAQCGTQAEAAKLLGLSSRKIFTFKRGNLRKC